MSDPLALAAENLLSPVILFFVLGLAAALARSDLKVPEQIAKALALYLLLAIGFKGGAGMAAYGLDGALLASLAAGAVISFLLPFLAFGLFRALTRLPRVDAASAAAHYGSISIVTFIAASGALSVAGIASEGFMVAVAAVMESPAILAGLLLARGGETESETAGAIPWREIALNGSIVLLLGAFAVGWITGAEGFAKIEPFIADPFQGVLCLFLLDMGLVAGRGLRESRDVLRPGLICCGLLLPVIGGAIGLGAGWMIGLSAGGTALLATLSASASYIAVPAAMRVALPEARPAVSLTLSLGLTFPFNLIIGIPAYIALAAMITA